MKLDMLFLPSTFILFMKTTSLNRKWLRQLFYDAKTLSHLRFSVIKIKRDRYFWKFNIPTISQIKYVGANNWHDLQRLEFLKLVLDTELSSVFDVYKFKPVMVSSLVGFEIWVVRGHVWPKSQGQMIATGSSSVLNCMVPINETFVSHVTKNDEGWHRLTTFILDAKILH